MCFVLARNQGSRRVRTGGIAGCPLSGEPAPLDPAGRVIHPRGLAPGLPRQDVREGYSARFPGADAALRSGKRGSIPVSPEHPGTRTGRICTQPGRVW